MSLNEQFVIEKMNTEIGKLIKGERNIESLIRIKAYCDLLLESEEMKPAEVTTEVAPTLSKANEKPPETGLLDF
ncbi:MAG: YwdI family protein [Bacillaceae bacterium]|nr:YwdI family protein [Bacillaceae bacterium]